MLLKYPHLGIQKTSRALKISVTWRQGSLFQQTRVLHRKVWDSMSKTAKGRSLPSWSEPRQPTKQLITAAKDIFQASVDAVLPQQLMCNSLKVEANTLYARKYKFHLDRNCYVVGFGKAVLGMAAHLEKILGVHLVSGIISIPAGIQKTFQNRPDMLLQHDSKIEAIEGAKDNIPDKNAHCAAEKIAKMVTALQKNALLILLVSGGGSALLPLPVPSVSLEEKSLVIQCLSKAGADIWELNSVRKQLSSLKGGKLAQLAAPATVLSLILSDIIGDPLDFIASGPNVANTDPPDIGWNIIHKYNLQDKIPPSVLQHLQTCKYTNKDGRNRNNFYHVHNILVGSNSLALKRAVEVAKWQGFEVINLSGGISGKAHEVGEMFATLLYNMSRLYDNIDSSLTTIKSVLDRFSSCNISASDVVHATELARKNKSGICVMSGGETTVHVVGNGRGGRNQELCLSCGLQLNKLFNTGGNNDWFVAAVSAGTDGIDGPTDAAGAVAYIEQVTIAERQKLDPRHFLLNNDSYSFFSNLRNGKDLIKTGHTGTNVMDIHILCMFPSSSRQ